jgi:hypothetical protein
MKPNERQGAEGKLHDRKTQKTTAVEIGGGRFERDGWLPIETAPKDGTDVLVFVQETGEQFVAYHDRGSWVYALIPRLKGGGSLCCAATYWMPLPEPPDNTSGVRFERKEGK